MWKKINLVSRKLLEWTITALLAIIFLIVFSQVVFRYIFGIAFDWIIDYSIIFFIYIVYLGTAVAVVDEEHIQINAIRVILDRVDERYEILLNVIKNVLVIIVMLVSVYGAYNLLPIASAQSLRATRFQRDIIVYPVFIGAFFTSLFSFSNIIINLKRMF